MNIFELDKCNLRAVVMEIFDNNIDPESEAGRIIQENEFAEGGKINAQNYRIQELDVIGDLSCEKLEDKEKTAESKNRKCKVRKL